jgi:hypothetical protein
MLLSLQNYLRLLPCWSELTTNANTSLHILEIYTWMYAETNALQKLRDPED